MTLPIPNQKKPLESQRVVNPRRGVQIIDHPRAGYSRTLNEGRLIVAKIMIVAAQLFGSMANAKQAHVFFFFF